MTEEKTVNFKVLDKTYEALVKIEYDRELDPGEGVDALVMTHWNLLNITDSNGEDVSVEYLGHLLVELLIEAEL